MNSNYTEFKFPQIKACQWRKVFRSKTTPDEAMDFIGKTLAYNPEKRVKPLEGCAHPFFDELRDERTRLPPSQIALGSPSSSELEDLSLPPLFNLTEHEMRSPPELVENVSTIISIGNIKKSLFRESLLMQSVLPPFTAYPTSHKSKTGRTKINLRRHEERSLMQYFNINNK